MWRFNIDTLSWEYVAGTEGLTVISSITSGPLPLFGVSASFSRINNSLYLYGGMDESK